MRFFDWFHVPRVALSNEDTLEETHEILFDIFLFLGCIPGSEPLTVVPIDAARRIRWRILMNTSNAIGGLLQLPIATLLICGATMKSTQFTPRSCPRQ